MKRKCLLFVTLGFVLMLTSCYKEQDATSLSEYDITLTRYDTEFDFNTYQNFYVRDSVMLYSDYLEDSDIAKFYEGTSDEIRNKIIEKFLSLGYTEVQGLENADFAINPIISLTKQEGLIYNWWWGYPGYWGWYGGWYFKDTDYYYYPPYWNWYPTYTYYNYKTGSMSLEMVDAESIRAYQEWLNEGNADTADLEDVPQIIFRWNAYIDGVLSSDAGYNTDRAARGFNEAFDQSPYLAK
jgi:hypothetical protein